MRLRLHYTGNLAQKNERSLSEVLTKKDFDKVLPIIEILEIKGSVTPSITVLN